MNIRPFNLVYFLCIFIIIALIIVTTLLCKEKSEKTKMIVLLSICGFNLLLFIAYKIGLASNPSDLQEHGYRFIIWEELPLHLCNISLFLVPIGLLIKNSKLLAYGFYIAPLGAFLAVCSPAIEFIDVNIFKIYNFGFYFTHLNIVLVGVLLVTLGFFKPRFKEVPFLNVYAAVLATIIHFVNLLIRWLTGSNANYFYTVQTDGVSILEMFWSIIPYSYIYLIFAIVILNVYIVIVTLPFHLVEKKKGSTVNA